MNQERHQIVNPGLALTALRDAGYKGTANAIAELVDNSIEAHARKVRILASESDYHVNQRTVSRVDSLAVWDDGEGMDRSILAKCLGFGFGTRLDSRNGIGRFGFGLKGASISQAKKVTIFSWREGKAPWFVYLDLDEVQSCGQSHLHLPQSGEIPEPWSSYLKDHGLHSQSGTLVIWEKCDRLNIKRSSTLFKHMKNDLCRIYRHFLDDDEEYGHQIDLRVDTVTDPDREPESLHPNDPLYLLKPNYCPGHSEESTNVMHDFIQVPIEYAPGRSSLVELRFTLALPEIQALGGNSEIGKHYGRNAGISFVRAGREIDFGDFGYIGNIQSEPRNRWWGAEVRFSPVLDDLFGVEATKQNVRGIGPLTDEQREEFEELTEVQDKESFSLKLRDELEKNIKRQVDQMMQIITSRKRGSKGTKAASTPKLVAQVNTEVQRDTSPTGSDEHRAKISREEQVQEVATVLKRDDTALTPQEAETAALTLLPNKVDVRLDDWPGDLFLDTKVAGGTTFAIVNRRHPFFKKFYEHLEGAQDSLGFEALQVVLMSFVRMEDELFNQIPQETFEQLRTKWGNWIQRLIQFAGN
jgi:hypothetical protein